MTAEQDGHTLRIVRSGAMVRIVVSGPHASLETIAKVARLARALEQDRGIVDRHLGLRLEPHSGNSTQWTLRVPARLGVRRVHVTFTLCRHALAATLGP